MGRRDCVPELTKENVLTDEGIGEAAAGSRIVARNRHGMDRLRLGVTPVRTDIVGYAKVVGASEGTKEWHRVEEAERSAKVGEAIADKDMTDANTQTLCIAGVTCIRIAEKKPDTGELNPEEE